MCVRTSRAEVRKVMKVIEGNGPLPKVAGLFLSAIAVSRGWRHAGDRHLMLSGRKETSVSAAFLALDRGLSLFTRDHSLYTRNAHSRMT
jgi:hypothetical protein